MRIRYSSFCALVLWLAPSLAFAWAGHDHSLLVARGFSRVAPSPGPDATVPVTAYDRFLSRIAPAIGIAPTPAAFAEWLGVNPGIDLGAFSPAEQVGGTVALLDLLRSHVNDPDDGRDEGVADKPAARFFGGRESQAFRHMEKPPLRWTDPAHTLGIPLGEAGEASLRAQIYFDLARLTWQLGEPYWAWRWLACSLHYIQDLTQPYHATQDNSYGRYFFSTIRVYLQNLGQPGGKGPIKTITQLISNSHHFYEDLVAYYNQLALMGRPHDARAIRLLTAMDGWSEPPPAPMIHGTDIRAFAKTLRDASNRRGADLLQAIHTMSGERLLSLYDYPQPGDTPTAFLKSTRDLDYLEAERVFFALTEASLRLGAHGTRELVLHFLTDRDAAPAEALAPSLRKMLAE
ncbi:MAG: hypothetical protein HY543_06805 [Deltaproteobacteria bacterium]|nr:hypothetical protein [Deltaproteobacteria bacterium]